MPFGYHPFQYYCPIYAWSFQVAVSVPIHALSYWEFVVLCVFREVLEFTFRMHCTRVTVGGSSDSVTFIKIAGEGKVLLNPR